MNNTLININKFIDSCYSKTNNNQMKTLVFNFGEIILNTAALMTATITILSFK